MVVVSPKFTADFLFLGYCERPGQARLDSGSLPAGWFPLPDAVGGHLGCQPSAPPLSVFVDLRAALGLDELLCTSVLSWATVVVTSTVRIKQLCEVCDTLLLTPMETVNLILRRPAKKISGREVWKLLSVVAQDFLLIPRSALTSLELCTNHR